MKNNAAVEPPKLVIRKVINASRERVFEAWTKPELMQRWFFPGGWSARTTNELKVGGKYSHDMISDGAASACHPEDKPEHGPQHYLHHGEYLEIVPPEKIVFTWNSPIVAESRVTVELRELSSGTELILTHELLETDELRKQHNQGWEGCLANLATFAG